MSRSTILSGLLGSLVLAGVVTAPGASAFTPEHARSSACDFAREVSTYHYAQDLDGYFQRVIDRTSGNLRAQWTDSREQLTALMRESQVSAHLEGLNCGVLSGDLLNAEIMVTMTQVRTKVGVTSRENLAITMRLNNDWGRWLVNEMKAPLGN
ncbi:hypothetical protein [Nocardia coubleae]|uniref:Mce-associated membrane protein n=1 Tax=Nocardia coubleae TaxID=356147 RepID=A0A846WE29_9NOCA|nr:hypothetical protein [Nocardia coubleae]NKX91033.1 hypothetical protein [Nocardia coubleae]